MFTRHKLRENALGFSLCGAIYPKQVGSFNQAEVVSDEDVQSMLGPMTVGCVCKTDENLQQWLKNNTH